MIITTIISSRDIVQLAERVFIFKNKPLECLARKQTPVYNQALYILRRGYFWWKYLVLDWRAYYTSAGSRQLSLHELQAMMCWLPICRGLYVSKAGKYIHADVNGAYNIVLKACPDAFKGKSVQVKQYPRRINVLFNESRKKSPDIFGWNGAGVGHHPKLVFNPVPS